MENKKISVRIVLSLIENQIVHPETKDSIDAVFAHAKDLEDAGIVAKYAAMFAEDVESSIAAGMSTLKNEDGTDDTADVAVVIINGTRFDHESVLNLIRTVSGNPGSIAVCPVVDGKSLRAGVVVEGQNLALPSGQKSQGVAWADLRMWATRLGEDAVKAPGMIISTESTKIVLIEGGCYEAAKNDYSRTFYNMVQNMTQPKQLDIRQAYKALADAALGGKILELPAIAGQTLAAMREELSKFGVTLIYEDAHIQGQAVAAPAEKADDKTVEFKK